MNGVAVKQYVCVWRGGGRVCEKEWCAGMESKVRRGV